MSLAALAATCLIRLCDETPAGASLGSSKAMNAVFPEEIGSILRDIYLIWTWLVIHAG